MEIILTANTNLEIPDLGIRLNDTESINLLDNFETHAIISSQDLGLKETDYSITIDSETISHEVMIERLTSLTKHEHNKLNVLQHNIYETNYFMVTKQDQKSKYITYYKDDTMTEKVQEDEIIRDAESKVSQIITRKYDNGVLYQEMTQILNRGTTGKVDSISTNTI